MTLPTGSHCITLNRIDILEQAVRLSLTQTRSTNPASVPTEISTPQDN